MKKIKKILLGLSISTLLPTASLIPLTSCGASTSSLTYDVDEETNFHHIKIGCTTADIQAAGIEFGDSVNISCTNGFKLENVPFMTGYFVKHGDWVLCSYNGGSQPLLAQSCRDGWHNSDLQKGNKLTITLNQKGNFKEVQDNLKLTPIYEKGEMTDEAWANFRDPSEQNEKMVQGMLYRGFSPLYNSAEYNERRLTVNALAKSKGIEYDIDLADDDERIQKHLAEDPELKLEWIRETYTNYKLLALKMSTDFQSKLVKTQIQTVMIRIIAQFELKKAVFIHCDEGKDRTGFIFMLLEALAGWTEQEICNDYMLTYKNFYGVEEGTKQYQLIKDILYQGSIEEITSCASETAQDKILDGAINYLISCGLLRTQVSYLADILKRK